MHLVCGVTVRRLHERVHHLLVPALHCEVQGSANLQATRPGSERTSLEDRRQFYGSGAHLAGDCCVCAGIEQQRHSEREPAMVAVSLLVSVSRGKGQDRQRCRIASAIVRLLRINCS